MARSQVFEKSLSIHQLADPRFRFALSALLHPPRRPQLNLCHPRCNQTGSTLPLGAERYSREQVLHLSYTAVDLQPMARDLGYEGDPFPWDEDDRRHRMARLDALFFHLYGIDRDDDAYILEQFPIVRREGEAAHGRYLTKDLILAYMGAVAAGDLDTRVTV